MGLRTRRNRGYLLLRQGRVLGLAGLAIGVCFCFCGLVVEVLEVLVDGNLLRFLIFRKHGCEATLSLDGGTMEDLAELGVPLVVLLLELDVLLANHFCGVAEELRVKCVWKSDVVEPCDGVTSKLSNESGRMLGNIWACEKEKKFHAP